MSELGIDIDNPSTSVANLVKVEFLEVLELRAASAAKPC